MQKSVQLILSMIILISINVVAQEAKLDLKNIKPALLVIDIQNKYLPLMAQEDQDNAMQKINDAIAMFRQYGFPIIRVYHHDVKYGFGPEPGTEDFEFPKSVVIKPEDPKIIKTYGNAFTKTDLDKVLKDKGCNTVFLCGLSATGCVLETYVGAHDHDYYAFMVENALLSGNANHTNSIEEIVNSVNFETLQMILDNVEK